MASEKWLDVDSAKIEGLAQCGSGIWVRYQSLVGQIIVAGVEDHAVVRRPRSAGDSCLAT